MNQNDKVSLGCGTLILIVLIVMIFGNMGSQNLEPQIHSLKNSIQDLERTTGKLENKIDQQTQHIEALRREIRRGRPEAGQ
jgi:predicted ribosome quality control (RQC) complex YloA/Tae2 family protein